MEILDFKSITAEAVAEICGAAENLPKKFFCLSNDGVQVNSEELRALLLEYVWKHAIRRVNEDYAVPETEAMAAEKTLAELVRRLILTEKVVYKKDSFRLQLKNGQYRIYKDAVKGFVFACPWPSEKRYEVGFPGRLLADFIIQFDAAIPDIVAQIPALAMTLWENEFEKNSDDIKRKLKEQALKPLIEQFVEPNGYCVSYSLKGEVTVSLEVEQSQTAHIEMPLTQLMEVLKDPEAFKKIFLAEAHPSVDRFSGVLRPFDCDFYNYFV